MARCNECIHKEICQFYNALGCKVLCQECGFFINKADVVPKSEVEKIFNDVEKIILENTYPYFDKDGRPRNIWKAVSGYDALAELKKKYTKSEDKG